MPWLNGRRYLLATDGPIVCVGLDDSLVTEYLSAHRGVRAVAGSEALVAAVSGDRQRLILWNGWDGGKPVEEVFLTSLTRHRVADITFAYASGGQPVRAVPGPALPLGG